MRSFLLCCLLLWSIASHASLRAGSTEASLDHSLMSSNKGATTTLFSSMAPANLEDYTVSSQNFTNFSQFTAAADDFTVPLNGWIIDQVNVMGDYFNGSGPADSVNIYILGNNAGLPDSTNLAAASIYAAENLAYTDTGDGDFSIALPGGVLLTGGQYWLVVQANMSSANGQWGWFESANIADSGNFFGAKSAWFQSIQLINGVSCVGAWGIRVDTCGLSGTTGSNFEFDLAFELNGTVLTPGVSISPLSLNLIEGGPSSSYTIALTAPPGNGETVTINVTGTDASEFSLDTNSLDFTSANWNIPQTITVTPLTDGVNDGDVITSVGHNVSASVSSGYNGVIAPSVNVEVQNIDGVAVITVSPTSGLNVSEEGTQDDSFEIALSQAPSGTVTVPVSADANTLVSNGGPFAATVDAVLTNTTALTITVRGNSPDSIDEADIGFTITTGPANAPSDLNFNGINPNDVTGTVLDDDVAGAAILANGGSTISTDENDEASLSAQSGAFFTVVLDTEPSAQVDIPYHTSDVSEGLIGTTQNGPFSDQLVLSFTPANWDIVQTVWVQGQEDSQQDGTVAYSIIGGLMSSSDNNYNGIDAGDIAAQNLDSGLLPTPVPSLGALALLFLTMLMLTIGFTRYPKHNSH